MASRVLSRECSARLLSRVEEHLRPLENVPRLRDSPSIKVSMQVQVRFP